MANFVNGTTDLANLIPEIWSPVMYQELRNSLVFGNIFQRDSGLERELAFGDVIRVNQIVAPEAEILTDDKQTFSTVQMNTNQFSVTVNKRASASFEFTNLAQLQSQSFAAQAQEALIYAIRKAVELDLITGLIPSAAAPDHQIAPASASDLAAVDIAGIRTLLSKALVPNQNRFLVLDPQYYGDLITKTAIASRDYIPAGSPTASGMISDPLYGFNMAEHNILGADIGYAVHPSALAFIMQQSINLEIVSLKSNYKHGFLMVADMVYGYSLFDNKRIVKISG